MKAPIVALAVSGHGFGHAVRCAEVARALTDLGARTIVRTDAPRWLFPDNAEHLPSPGWPLDVGVAQHDGLDLDVDETRRRWAAFADRSRIDGSRAADSKAGLLRRRSEVELQLPNDAGCSLHGSPEDVIADGKLNIDGLIEQTAKHGARQL